MASISSRAYKETIGAVKKILKNTLSCGTALLGVELGGVEVVLVQRCAERKDVISIGCGPVTDGNVEAVYKVNVLRFVKTLEDTLAVGLYGVPAHMRNLVLMALRVELEYRNVKYSQTLGVTLHLPCTRCSHRNAASVA